MSELHHELDDDDRPVGRLLSRREALTALGGLSASSMLWLAGCKEKGTTEPEVPEPLDQVCAVRPQLTEGPYFVDSNLRRSDLRTDTNNAAIKEGVTLALNIGVARIGAGGCTPIEGVQVEVWQADAMGVYSGVLDGSFDTRGQNWLRGYVIAGPSGIARFTTIVPGWYQGRSPHIHFKIRSTAATGGTYEFTSQLFFPDGFTSDIYRNRAPYRSRGDSGRLNNEQDGIYRQGGGDQLLLNPTAQGDGYLASFNVGLYV